MATPTPVFLPGKSHGQKSPAGYSPKGHKQTRLNMSKILKKQTNKSTQNKQPKKPGQSLAPVLFFFVCIFQPGDIAEYAMLEHHIFEKWSRDQIYRV